MIAIFPSLSFQELFLLFLIGLLLYGRNLPEAGRSLGRVVGQLKRSFYEFKDQLDREGELRDVTKVIKDTAREVKGVARVPRAMSNPAGALRDLTHEAMTSASKDEDATSSNGTAASGEDHDDARPKQDPESKPEQEQ